jgi:predicted HTH transcriptional regulator
LDDEEYTANALTLVKNGVDFMRKHNHVMWHKPGLTRVEMPDYPLEAMTEALTKRIVA